VVVVVVVVAAKLSLCGACCLSVFVGWRLVVWFFVAGLLLQMGPFPQN
jgi:hypothetical protein